jgi:endonuclease-3
MKGGKTREEIVIIIRSIRNSLGITKATVAREDPFQVLISTVLSQRTRDENTEKASQRLFSKYKAAEQLASAPLKNIEQLIKPSGFYRVKAKRIKQISQILVKKYRGKVPQKFEELMKLPGVGRKTANCVLVFAYRLPAIPVDTHVHRISNRIGLVKTKTPEETETELVKTAPKEYWVDFNELFVRFGQRICQPIKPLCWKCPIVKYCDYPNKNLKPKR